MRFVKPDIVTTALGMANSMGGVPARGGDERDGTRRTAGLLHQPSIGGLAGQAMDVQIHAGGTPSTQAAAPGTRSWPRTPVSPSKIRRDTDRDYILGARLHRYGVIDNIVQQH